LLTTFIEPDDLVGYGDELVQAPGRHPMTHIASVMRSRGYGSARIGLELNSYYLGARAYEVLRDELPGAVWVDASLLVNWVRVVKSAAEIRYMREAARIMDRAMRVAIENVRPGVRQCDAAAAIYHALISGTEDHGGQYASSPPLMPSGNRADTPHLSWTDDRYEAGSITNLELVAARHRYHVPLGRSVALGRPGKQALTLERALVEGIEEVLSRLRPGLSASDVEAIWQNAAGRHGVRKRARCGYSIGIAYPPTFGEQTVSLRPGDHTVLRENMTLHLMPGLWQEGESLVITEPLLVTANGCEPLCHFERRLFIQE
jgi:Xaa-Pro aminopeptidase